MSIYSEAEARTYLGVTDGTNDTDLRNVPSKPVCTCARTIKVDGEVFEVHPGGTSRNAGCRVHCDNWEARWTSRMQPQTNHVAGRGHAGHRSSEN